jgi:hypothetical protein
MTRGDGTWRMSRMRTLWFGMSLAALLCACSQDDPGSTDGGKSGSSDAGRGGRGGSDAGDSGSGGSASGGVANDYYPMVAGSSLTYRKDSVDEVTRVSATEFDGESAWLTEGDPDAQGDVSKNTIIQIGTQILRAHKEELRNGTLRSSVDYEPGFIRFDRAWADAEEGETVMLGYQRTETLAGGSMLPADQREHTYTIEESPASVTVPAGTFDECMKVRRLRVRNVGGTGSSDDDDKVFWFCKGIGKVKESAVIQGAETTNEELVSCDIVGGACP